MTWVDADVFKIIAAGAKVDSANLTRDTNLRELNLASLDVVEIIFAIEETFDIAMPCDASDLSGEVAGVVLRTVGDIVDAIIKMIAQHSAAEPPVLGSQQA